MPAALAAATLTIGLALPTAACSEEPGDKAAASGAARSNFEQAAGEERAVSNLPFARGRTFRTLDEYLAHLEQQAAIDLPYWRQIAPGIYERVSTRRPAGKPERATRAELMERFGFTR